MNRRTFLQAAISGLSGLAWTRRSFPGGRAVRWDSSPGRDLLSAGDTEPSAGPVRNFQLNAEPSPLEIPSRGVFQRWLYNGQFPGPEIRASEGEHLRLAVKNNLPEGTTVHWHGVPLRNAMDGVPDITQPAISPGETFIYEFDGTSSGTFFYHSHFGLQPERGLVGSLVIEEKKPHIQYDRDVTLSLSDFLPGPPVPIGMSMMGGQAMGSMLVPPYTILLINGRPPESPAVFDVKKGERIRIRLINPSGTSVYRFAIGGHSFAVTHCDGRPVEPLSVDSLYLGPGERYDILVEAKNPGAWPIAASADTDLPPARAILRYTDSNEAAPRDNALPEGLSGGRLLQLSALRGLDLPEPRKPDRTFNLALSGIVSKSAGRVTQQWMINGQAYPNAAPIEIHSGESIRFRLENRSDMPHPMHLHGHFFRVANVLKDTTTVWPRSGHVDLDFAAHNAGSWLFHCHNIYHMDSGMMRLVRYV